MNEQLKKEADLEICGMVITYMRDGLMANMNPSDLIETLYYALGNYLQDPTVEIPDPIIANLHGDS